MENLYKASITREFSAIIVDGSKAYLYDINTLRRTIPNDSEIREALIEKFKDEKRVEDFLKEFAKGKDSFTNEESTDSSRYTLVKLVDDCESYIFKTPEIRKSHPSPMLNFLLEEIIKRNSKHKSLVQLAFSAPEIEYDTKTLTYEEKKRGRRLNLLQQELGYK